MTATGTTNTLNGESALTMDGTTFTANTTNFVVNSTNITVGNDTADVIGIGSNTMYINNSNVGIGTTSPSQKLHVSGSGTLVSLIDSSGTYSVLRLKNNIRTSDIGTDPTGLYMDSGGSYPIMFYAGSTERMRLDSAGELGIGTTNPTVPLHVDGNGPGATVYTGLFTNGSSTTSVYNVVRWTQGAAGSATGMIGTGGSTTGNAAFQNTFVVGTQTAHSLVLASNDTERARIDASGNVGIGTTNPQKLLHVQGDISASVLSGSLTQGGVTNITEMSMVVSGTIAAAGGTTVTLNLNNSNYFAVSASGTGTVTWVATNPPPTGRVQTFVIEYVNGGVVTNSWFSGIRWSGGVAPTLTTGSNPDLLGFTTDDNGTIWRGNLLQRNSS